MDSWKNFVKTVLLGQMTDEASLAYFQQLYESMGLHFGSKLVREHRILRITALRQQLQKGAQCPAPPPSNAFEKAPPEDLPYCSDIRMQQLKNILRGQLDPLLRPFFEIIICKNQLIQPAAIPFLLDKVKPYPSLHALLNRIGGYRLQWLAKLRKEWSFIVEQNYQLEDFEYGSVPNRIGYFRQLRSTNPEAAMQLMMQVWGDESHQTKVKLLECLQLSLQESDIEFLETILDDKRKSVRQKAIVLVAQLKNSPYVQRMQKHMQTYLEFNILTSSYSILLPQIKLNKAMKRDGIEYYIKKKEADSTFILLQIITKTPLDWWESTLGLQPEALLEWAQSQKLFKTILSGWLAAAYQFKSKAWLILIHQFYTRNCRHQIGWKNFVDQFNYEQIENQLFNQYIQHYFQLKTSKVLEDNEVVVQLLLQENREWSSDTALKVIESIQLSIHKNTHVFHWNLKTVLKRAAYAVPLSLYQQMKSNWPSHTNNWQSWEKEVLNFLDTMKFRAQINFIED